MKVELGKNIDMAARVGDAARALGVPVIFEHLTKKGKVVVTTEAISHEPIKEIVRTRYRVADPFLLKEILDISCRKPEDPILFSSNRG